MFKWKLCIYTNKNINYLYPASNYLPNLFIVKQKLDIYVLFAVWSQSDYIGVGHGISLYSANHKNVQHVPQKMIKIKIRALKNMNIIVITVNKQTNNVFEKTCNVSLRFQQL